MGQTLVVAEKPSVGRDIAGALPGTFKASQDKTHLVGDDYIITWTIGHLVLTSRSMMKRCGVSDFPPLPDDFEKRFARDEAAPKACDFGDASILRPLFKQHHERFAAVARSMTPEQLDTSLGSNHPFFKTIGTMLAFAPVHISMHTGQISTIRRSLGRPPIS